MKLKLYFMVLLIGQVLTIKAQDLKLYAINMIEGEQASHSCGFVSLSDSYPVNEDDKLVMPDVSGLAYEEAVRIELPGQYRIHFLKALKLSETDNVFVYNYADNILVTLPVKEAGIAAWLNAYTGPGEEPFRRDDYMIGFEIPLDKLKDIKDNTANTLVYVGKNNPFEQGNMKRMTWQPVGKKDFPNVPVSAESIKWLDELGYEVDLSKTSDFYKSEAQGYTFYAQHYTDEEGNPSARRLLVLDAKSKKTVTERLFFNSEGTMLVPLGTDQDSEQFTGKLFKSKPPVTLGFEYASFGCEFISVISQNKENIDINCDNRH